MSFHSLSPLREEPIKSGSPSPNSTFPRLNVVTKNLKTAFNANPSTWWSPPLETLLSPITQPHSQRPYIAQDLHWKQHNFDKRHNLFIFV